MEHLWPILMLLGLMAGIFSGYPVAFVLAGIGILFAFLNGIPIIFLSLGVGRIFSGVLANWLLVAIPLFVFMGLMLERSGIAERLLRSLASVFRGMPGAYAFAVAIIGVVMAASTGIIGASVVLMGMMALPAMKENRYDMRLASGLIASSGTLGILIPPSIMLIILGDQLRLSVGDLFMGAIVPGLLLGVLYVAYLLAVAILQPQRMPPATKADPLPFSRALWQLTRDLLAPMILIFSVLGTIVAGIATPTESAAIGAAGAMVLALASGNLRMKALRESLYDTTSTTAMIVFVMIGASIFSVVFRRLGGDAMLADLFLDEGSSPMGVMLTIMALIFLLGFFLEWVEITLVVVPIVAPILGHLDFGMPTEHVLIWFAIALAVNLQTSFLTPPFGYALFYLRGIAPDLPISTIYRGVIPFVVLQLMALALVLVFPSLALDLPLSLR
ncbi:MAG: TRAP transporter large permease subunit [Rhodobacterales bacterium]|uniref:TRAP transporter large permease n=1 Tax=Gemmobacter nectariphilus TaxID=220343 RepID=UPI0004174CFA|nr:TRAP transporter large permease subunit [Gemmobacter nectariphilus]MDX5357873.1 TRAP transporter large permease subunit [Rhodobacterales bacterium]MDX5500119.1 TRAP transporter large permease subunit [Rhodobacterales bacterium]